MCNWLKISLLYSFSFNNNVVSLMLRQWEIWILSRIAMRWGKAVWLPSSIDSVGNLCPSNIGNLQFFFYFWWGIGITKNNYLFFQNCYIFDIADKIFPSLYNNLNLMVLQSNTSVVGLLHLEAKKILYLKNIILL